MTSRLKRRFFVTVSTNAGAVPVGDGITYEEAVAGGRNAIESFIEIARQDNQTLPQPKVFDAA